MIDICGRRVKIVTGSKSQTVNVYSPENVGGTYDYIIRIVPPFPSLEESLRQQAFASLEELVRYLEKQHFGRIERTPLTRPTAFRGQPQTLPPVISAPRAKAQREANEIPTASSWEHKARAAVEQSIDQFILEFIEYPYLHRVEHSIHCELFRILTSRRILGGTCPMGRWVTQPVHKEWPEFHPRPEKGNRRGNFDLCILNPERLKSCSYTDFREGRIRPTFVIEVGLDYSLAHLSADATKLKNSGIEDSYLVHLVREDVVDDFGAVEEFILRDGMKTAYVRITSSQAFFKLVNEKKIRTGRQP